MTESNCSLRQRAEPRREQVDLHEVVDDALKTMPPEWVDGDEEAVEALLEKLLRR